MIHKALILISQAVRATLVFVIITTLFFPLLILLISRTLFSDQAKGTLLYAQKEKVIGSALIGQQFSRPEYFHSRPSAADIGYAAQASGGTNSGPTSAKLFEGAGNGPKGFPGVKQLANNYRQENGLALNAKIPVDAVTYSGSGLDPHISTANAYLQTPRVAKARRLPLKLVLLEVDKWTQSRQLWILGEPGVNVLLLNVDLDKMAKKRAE